MIPALPPMSWQVPARSSRSESFFVEGIEPSTIVEDVNWVATITRGLEPDTKNTTVYQLDMDVDSNNNGTIDGDAEDKMEISTDADKPGKIIVTGLFKDSDEDDVPDFADGLGFNTSVGGNESGTCGGDEAKLVPLKVELKTPIDPANAEVVFDYGESASIPRDGSDGHVIIAGAGTLESPRTYHLKKTGLRIWAVDAPARDGTAATRQNIPAPGAKFIPPGKTLKWSEIAAAAGQPLGRTLTLYLEYATSTPLPGGSQTESIGKKSFRCTEVAEGQSSGIAFDDVTVCLVPFVIKVNSANPPAGTSGAKYTNPDRPTIGNADNLFSVWPGEDFTVKVKLPESFQLPSGLIKWTAAGESIPDNTKEHTFNWSTTGTMHVKIKVGESKFSVWVDLPDVGSLSQGDALLAVDPISSASLALYGAIALTHANQTWPTAVPKKDAIRHSYWTAMCASDILVSNAAVLLVTTAHEHNNKFGVPNFFWQTGAPQDAFNTTMDLRNNLIGLATGHFSVLGTPEFTAILQDLENQYQQGLMWIYDGSTSETASEGILNKSNQQKIYAP